MQALSWSTASRPRFLSSYHHTSVVMSGPNTISVIMVNTVNMMNPISSEYPVVCMRPIGSSPFSMLFMNIDMITHVSMIYVPTTIINWKGVTVMLANWLMSGTCTLWKSPKLVDRDFSILIIIMASVTTMPDIIGDRK